MNRKSCTQNPSKLQNNVKKVLIVFEDNVHDTYTYRVTKNCKGKVV